MTPGSPVPRYYFHTRIGTETLSDEEGVVLHDPDHAWQVARATIRDSLAEEADQARLMSASLVVTDEAGEIVFEFPFAEAIDVPEPGGTRH